MATEEEKYQASLEAEGVELDEFVEKTEDKADPEPEKEKESEKPVTEPDEDEPEVDPKKKPEEDPNLQTKKPESHKRSIYHDLKNTQKEVKSERERADIAEQKANDLQEKLDAVSKAKDEGKSSAHAEDDLKTFLEEHEVDPVVAERLIAEARKGIKPEIDEETRNDLAEFKAWKQDNRKVAESQAFEKEFTASLPSIKEFFPTANDSELSAIKAELDTLSHTKEWHDKSLKYIAFEHKDTLSALITPRKRGMESRERKDTTEVEAEFNPNPDFSKMTVKEMDAWNKTYRDAGKSEGLTVGANGKKFIL